MKIRKISILILILISVFTLRSQSLCDTLPFIRCEENKIVKTNDEKLNHLVEKFKQLKSDNPNSINIVHIGDSHLQAGFLSEKIKQQLFQYFASNDTIASPGFLFPFTIAQTNNPFYYKVEYTGNWSWCKNVDSEKTCSLGLSGITVKTNDSVASFSIKMQNDKYDFPAKYFFNIIKILHNADSSLLVKVNNEKVYSKNGFSIAQLANLTDSISVNISINDTSKAFELYGIILINDKLNINYHTIGVNGATSHSYLKCDYFSTQLALINPDLVIISLGTNEAFDDDFSFLEHEYILKDLILQIKDAVPNSSILLVTPNDHSKEEELNKRVLRVRKNILKNCNEFQLAYWDFFTIMGGENSINDWYNNELTANDKIHFRKKGYEIQGKLFVNALIKLLEEQ
ncbi:GDSL-type esterase/lipase family protein [Bacteroidota bacterium]